MRAGERERKLIFINLPLSEERSGNGKGGRARAAAASAAASKFDCFSDGGTDERTSEGANN